MRRAINPVLGALGGALALALAVGTAGAQDTSRTGQTEMPKMPGRGGVVDTAGYPGAERPDTGPMTYTRDTTPAGQDTSAARTGAVQDTSTTHTRTKSKAKGKKGKRTGAGAADTAGGRTMRGIRSPNRGRLMADG